MFSLGVEEQITQFYYYTSTFEQRLQIIDYIKAFKIEKDAPIIVRSYDYIELVTNEFSMLVSLFSNILLVFTSISMGVSGLLIGILMYISVLERNKEIGLLRSMDVYDGSNSYWNFIGCGGKFTRYSTQSTRQWCNETHASAIYFFHVRSSFRSS